MTKKKKKFWEVLPAGEMRKKYGLYAENRPTIKLDPEKIPRALHCLIPYAELWGIGDDLIRSDLISKTPPKALEELQKAIQPLESALDDWLAGPDADSPPYSKEYLAFTAMRMAADGC